MARYSALVAALVLLALAKGSDAAKKVAVVTNKVRKREPRQLSPSLLLALSRSASLPNGRRVVAAMMQE